jgi:hypothetical protein
VTLNGQPCADVVVMFNPRPGTPARMSSAHTDSAGRFALETASPHDGAMPGDYTVTFDEYYPPGKAPAMPKGGGPLPSRFPVEYGNPDRSPLTAHIERGAKNDFQFEIKK